MVEPVVLVDLSEHEGAAIQPFFAAVNEAKLQVYEAQVALTAAERRVEEAEIFLAKRVESVQAAIALLGAVHQVTEPSFGVSPDFKTLVKR